LVGTQFNVEPCEKCPITTEKFPSNFGDASRKMKEEVWHRKEGKQMQRMKQEESIF
jgi:hypothetical protein